MDRERKVVAGEVEHGDGGRENGEGENGRKGEKKGNGETEETAKTNASQPVTISK